MEEGRYPRRQPLGVPGPAEAGLTVLGRLLVVGLAAGTCVGLLVGIVVAFPEPWGPDGVSWLVFFGAAAGLLTGVPTQVVTAGLLRAGRGRGRGRVPQRLLVAAAPATVAGGSAWIVAAAEWSSPAHGVVAVVVAVAAASAAALATRRWCLNAPGAQHSRARRAAH